MDPSLLTLHIFKAKGCVKWSLLPLISRTCLHLALRSSPTCVSLQNGCRTVQLMQEEKEPLEPGRLLAPQLLEGAGAAETWFSGVGWGAACKTWEGVVLRWDGGRCGWGREQAVLGREGRGGGRWGWGRAEPWQWSLLCSMNHGFWIKCHFSPIEVGGDTRFTSEKAGLSRNQMGQLSQQPLGRRTTPGTNSS